MTRDQILSVLKAAINPDQLRQAFKGLAFKLHPDVGGNTRSMQDLLAVYEQLMRAFSGKTFHRKSTTGEQTEYKYSYNETAENEFTTKLSETIAVMPNTVTIEVRGSWIWIHGETKPVKDRIKELGYFWKASDAEWYWRSSDQKKKFRGYRSKTRDEIRASYGSSMHSGAQQAVKH